MATEKIVTVVAVYRVNKQKSIEISLILENFDLSIPREKLQAMIGLRAIDKFTNCYVLRKTHNFP